MRTFSKLLVASLKEFSRDRTTLSFTVILPLLLVAFFGFAFSGSKDPLKVGIVSFRAAASNRYVKTSRSEISALRNDSRIHTEAGALSTELSRLRNGSVDAVVSLRSGRVRVYYDQNDGKTALAAATLSAVLASSQGSHSQPSDSPAVPGSAVSLTPVAGISNSRLDFVIPGILATAIMWLGIFAAIPLVQQREQQVLRRFAVTPVSRSNVVLAQVVSRLVVSLAQAIFILAAAKLLFGVPLGTQISSGLGAVGVIAALVLLGALAFVAIGYAVAAVSSTQSSAHAWAQLLTMPMLVLAGVFFPITLMPGVLKPLVAILPLTYLADALRQTAMSGQSFVPLSVDLAVLSAWVLASLAVAIRFFRWSQ